MQPDAIRIVLVAGVSGAGKTTVAKKLADRLGWVFLEGDELHPAANIERMARGEPLTDEDRGPWLDALRARIDDHLDAGTPAVITTSALRRSYRDRLRVGDPRVLLVFLEADPGLVEERLESREGHFFKARLAASQFATLEPPERGLVLPAEQPVAALVDRIVAHIRSSDGA